MTIAMLALFALEAIQPGTPEVRPAECSRWQGTVSGNDPSVSVSATLCPGGGGRVRGTLVWQSQRSGTSTRVLDGVWTAGKLVLHDTELTGRPNAGWRFCRVDQYTMTQTSAGKLEGTYHSSACADDATITLVRR